MKILCIGGPADATWRDDVGPEMSINACGYKKAMLLYGDDPVVIYRADNWSVFDVLTTLLVNYSSTTRRCWCPNAPRRHPTPR